MNLSGNIQLNISWDEGADFGTAFTATSGCGVLRIGDKVVWGGNSSRGIHWHWVDFLAFLSDNWGMLVFEQSYPLPVQPAFPHLLRWEAKKRWESERRAHAISHERYLDEEEKVFWFESQHNLARALDGLSVPDVFLLRQRSNMIISGSDFSFIFDFMSVRGALKEIGDRIAERLSRCDDETAKARLEEWSSRHPSFSVFSVKTYTGASDDFLTEISGGKLDVVFGAGGPCFQETAVLAAARMAWDAYMPPDATKALLEKIREQRKVPTPALDVFSDKAPPANFRLKPAVNGRELAQWLLGELHDAVNEATIKRINPEHLLRSWGVPLIEMDFGDRRADALTCWGDDVGPLVLLNSKSARNALESGVRAALAHEICHLLADRTAGLPFADVVGGYEDERADWSEQRARAFAAEFLLPSAIIAENFRETAPGKELNIPSWIEARAKEYRVSNEIVVWQLYRSDVGSSLTQEHLDELKPFVTHPEKLV